MTKDMTTLLIHKKTGFGLISVALIRQLEAIRNLPVLKQETRL